MADDWALTAAEIATELDIKRSTVDSWVHRGHITAIPGTWPKKYRMSEVYEAEKQRRDNEARTRRNITRRNDMTNATTC
ncbi:terminase gpP N-terminus-related DNA-binding protein [Allonocardiopsis opalescens]|uniref:Putative ATPase subunit gpP of terminase n=1 Tax=Allonocardiopsis opalescens TaxID=1144618 RepID=A0A2T0PSV0_9ACTN|nr:helix-turn-helix domain-containing protein [Allonocardiopsis opalescens]PRX91973.1 putative ATPase subunit gpP of terminase [Allonocardiopsis opalescens]